MPLTEYQREVAQLLAASRSPDSYLAGGAALHLQPNSKRYSNDLDFFQDSIERTATAFARDRELLEQAAHAVAVDMQQPGYIRAVVTRNERETKIEWAHDSAWRFLPTVACEEVGYRLHPVDLAVSKTLTLAGRNEPRDFFDVLHAHDTILPLGAACWAAAGKDPGFTPLSLLELLGRRGSYRPEDFNRLHLVEPVDLRALKVCWRAALEAAVQFVETRPPEEVGCLYYDPAADSFVQPAAEDTVVCHYGRPGGIWPRVLSD